MARLRPNHPTPTPTPSPTPTPPLLAMPGPTGVQAPKHLRLRDRQDLGQSVLRAGTVGTGSCPMSRGGLRARQGLSPAYPGRRGNGARPACAPDSGRGGAGRRQDKSLEAETAQRSGTRARASAGAWRQDPRAEPRPGGQLRPGHSEVTSHTGAPAHPRARRSLPGPQGYSRGGQGWDGHRQEAPRSSDDSVSKSGSQPGCTTRPDRQCLWRH